MERPSIWVIIVVLLLGVLFLREPRFQRSDQPATLSRRTVQDVIGSAGAPPCRSALRKHKAREALAHRGL